MAGQLISAQELRAASGRDDVRIVDCRWYLGEPEAGAEAYRSGHIPEAVYASLDDDLAAPPGIGRHPLPDPAHFARTVRKLGISEASTVIAYDDRGGAIAARLWWMLTQQGHRDTRVLDGGIQAWLAAGFPLTTKVPPPVEGDFPIGPWSGTVDVDAVIRAAGSGRSVVDARAPARYRGDEEPIDPKAGHIPGALSMPLDDNLDSGLCFHRPEAVRHRLTTVGMDDELAAIAMCGSGVTACHLILAAEVAGLARPDLYVGSWSDWSSRDLPIVVGDEP